MSLFNRIDKALESHGQGKDTFILNISELDGFFHALACSPDLIRPSVWVHSIWGGIEHAPKWPNMKSAQAFMNDVITHYNDIMATLGNNKCEPVFLEIQRDNTVHIIVEDWCFGFQRGLTLLSDHADILTDNFDLLTPVLLFSSNELAPRLDELSQTEIQQYQNRIPECVLGIRKLLSATSTALITPDNMLTETVENTPSTTGRNDLCSCGSRKKYKACCGAN